MSRRAVPRYVDEEGKLKGLPVNVAATMLARSLGWPAGDVLCGPFVLLGDDPAGDERSVPDDVVAHVRGMFGPRVVDETIGDGS